MIKIGRYREVLVEKSFGLFWLGFTLSVLGDTMSRFALIWFVYDLTESPEALGLLALTYTGPVIVGGLLAGWLLDRFDRRNVLIVDNVLRGMIFLLIPILQAIGLLQLWHIYLLSTVYGSLMMVPLAGVPSIVPDLVSKRNLATANALETLSYTLSATIGPLIAGFLIPVVGSANIVLLDAISYFVFAALILSVSIPHDISPTLDDHAGMSSFGLGASFRLLRGDRILASTTIMFVLFNLGLGGMLVWLPILADQVLDGGSQLYGLLLGALALGELMSATLAGTLEIKVALGRLICFAQLCSGISLTILLFSTEISSSLITVFLFGFFSAPLTIWAQTLRMRIIPATLRGRAFAILRTLMQGALPLGGVAAGFVLPLLSMSLIIGISATVAALPGLGGMQVKELWNSSLERDHVFD